MPLTRLLQFLALVDLGFVIFGTIAGAGRHVYYLKLEHTDVGKLLKVIFVSEFVLYLALFFVKLSVTLFILRLGGLRKWLRVVLVLNALVLFASTLAYFVVLFVQCKPIAANWDPNVPDPVCISIDVLVTVTYIVTGWMIQFHAQGDLSDECL